MLTREDMHQYQVEAVDYIIDTPKAYLALDLGLGKTVIALTAISDLLAAGEIKSVFVIAPLRVVYNVWRQEAAQWEHIRHLTFSIIHGGNKGTTFRNTTADVNLINIEGMLWVRDNKPKKLPGCMLIVDEASMLKSPSTQRFKVLKRYHRQFSRAVMMSGTPAPNSLLNLWAPYYLLDGGDRLFPAFYRYKSACFRQTDWHGYTWEIKPGMKPLIYQKVADITLRLDKYDHLDMPELVVVPTKTSLDEKTRKLYDKLEKEMFLEFEDHEVSATMAPVIALKCQQLSQGFLYTDEGETVTVHKNKLEALTELLEELDGQPALVPYHFKADFAALHEAFPKASYINGTTTTAEDEQTIRLWNRGEIPLLFAQAQGISHGLNLQKGGSVIIWYSMTWSAEIWDQTIGRVHRQGQKSKSVRIFVLMNEDTIDEVMFSVVNSKLEGQKQFLDALNTYRGSRS